MARALCGDCKFWSDRLAYANGGGPVFAFCLNTESPKHNRDNGGERGYTAQHDGCAQHELGDPVDSAA